MRETPPGAALGVVGPALAADCPPLFRASRLDRFQETAGEIAEARPVDPRDPRGGAGGVGDGLPRAAFLAGRAAANAFVAKVASVALSTVSESDASAWCAAIVRLLADAPIDLVVVPGALDLDLQRRLVEAAHEARDPNARRLPVVVDAPPDVRPDAALQRQQSLTDALPAHTGVAIHVAMPWARSHAPGRPGLELTPASCLVAPLLLSASPTLAGNHEVPRPSWPEASLARLTQAGGRILVPVGRRRKVALFGAMGVIDDTGPSRSPASAPAPALPRRGPGRAAVVEGVLHGMQAGLEARLRSALRAKFEPLYMDLRDGRREPSQAWPLIVRAAKTVLEHYVRRGELTRYRVRCDADTNEGAPPNEPRVEVWIEHPRRVSSFTVHVGAAP